MKGENNVEVEVEAAQKNRETTNRSPDEEGRTRVATDNILLDSGKQVEVSFEFSGRLSIKPRAISRGISRLWQIFG
jgi:hypothetical protein